MEESIIKFMENLPSLLKTIALLGITKGIIGIYVVLHKENKKLHLENFSLKDELEELKKNKICINCKELEI